MDPDCADTYSLAQSFGPGGSLVLQAVDPDLPSEQLALGTLAPEEPVAFRVPQRRKVGDLVGTGSVAPSSVSPALVRCLSEHGFAGWSTFPIRVEVRRRTSSTGIGGCRPPAGAARCMMR